MSAEPDSTIKVDAGKVLNRITPLMYGSCIEDVNHEIYGGLYAQMIFGESFEEPPRDLVPGWRSYGGDWTVQNGVCSVKADSGAKLIWSEPTIADGTVECDVRLEGGKGDCAGLILRLNDPRIGPDAFTGYEVSIVQDGFVRLGRHRNNWEMLKAEWGNAKPGEWHHLRVDLAGREIRIYVDRGAKPIIQFTDNESPIAEGKVGLRNWQTDASFRNLTVESHGKKLSADFQVQTTDRISGMWDAIRTDGAVARYTWDDTKTFNSRHSQKIEFVRGEGTVGVANRGLNGWGLTFREGQTYSGRLHLWQNEFDNQVSVALQSADGKRTYAKLRLGPNSDWGTYYFDLKSTATDTNARFAISVERHGTIWVDQVYLSGTGNELFKGLPVRADIGRTLQEQGLTVLRYGGSMVNASQYRWKNMVDQLDRQSLKAGRERDRRPQYKGWWYPYSTNGFGIEEFVQFCEAAKFEKVFAINIEETPEDAADLVEYLNGPATSKWGAVRAKNGHAAPYGVKYIEIGNEEKTAPHYIERFKLLYDAMHAKDPSVQFIIAAWWEPDNPVTKRIVQELDGKAALWDVHVGGDDLHEGRNVDALFTRMEKLVQEWAPKTPLKACVLEENGGRHDLQRALGHACILNATQRHGDFVLIDCPANCLQPWQQNDNDWDQGQVFFTSSQVWAMPPFYSQQMAAAAHQPCRVQSEIKSPGDELDLTATRSDDGKTLVLNVVSIGAKPHRAAIDIAGLGAVAAQADVITLAGNLTDFNPPDAADRVHSIKSKLDNAGERFEYDFPAHSYTVIKLSQKK